MKIQYALSKKETGNASGKAKNDAMDIALKKGFALSYSPSQYRWLRVIQQYFSMNKFKKEGIIFFQYPAVDTRLLKTLIKKKNNQSRIVALIHDLPSIQGITTWPRDKDAECLKYFDCIIVHNNAMKQYVLSLGYTGHIVVLELFDYLHDKSKPVKEPHRDNSISFAGNMTKAKFIQDLNQISSCKFLLYGNKGDLNFDNEGNVLYQGLLPSDQIQYLMEGDFGLVWDGDSIDTCSGVNGEYLRYNNPHKLSLCMASGKPVITWKQAAIADFITKYHVGFAVDSLEELDKIDLYANYDTMRNNVLEIKKKVADGYYLYRAIDSAIELVNK